MNILVASYYDEIALPVMRRFCEQQGARVSDWFIGHPSQNPAIAPAGYVPGAVVHDILQASRGLLPYDLPPKKWPSVDRAMFERMRPYERIFSDLLGFYDPSGHEFSEIERQSTYRALLQFGLHILRERRPGLYISFTMPHSLHAYMLYALCRAHGIPTLVWEAFALPGFLLLNPSVEEMNPALRNDYAARIAGDAVTEVELPAPMEAYCAKVQSTYDKGMPWYSLLRDHSMIEERGRSDWLRSPLHPRHPLRPALRWMRRQAGFGARMLMAPRHTWRDWAQVPMGDFFKRRGVPLQRAATTKRDYQKLAKAALRRLHVLLASYRRLQRAPEMDAPFIFVPLHFQPEVSTTPMGGYFADQVAMVDLLAKSLPPGWRLYVKEHRTIFDPGVLRGSFARDESYYERLAAIPGVTLVPMQINSFDLIDRARAVATVTGTGAWEGILRGKPAILFGSVWFRACEGVFDGQHEGALREAMAAIAGGFTPDARKVRAFLKSVVEMGTYADRDNTYILTDLSAQQSEDALVALLVREYRRFYSP
jgi:hypothetical protein